MKGNYPVGHPADPEALLITMELRAGDGIAGFSALGIGRPASMAMRFPETGPASDESGRPSAPGGRSASESLRSREYWCLRFTWALAGAVGGTYLVMPHRAGLWLWSGLLGTWLSGCVRDATRDNATLVFSSLGPMCLAAATRILMVNPWRACRI